MSEAQEPRFYPGPWEVFTSDEGAVWVQETNNPDRLIVCDIPGDMETIKAEELANADLIAAAPDLYHACEAAAEKARCIRVIDGLEPCRSHHCVACVLAAALARARGEGE